MSKYVYEIKGVPVAWSSHRGYGKKSFNPHYEEKRCAQWQLKLQHSGRPIIERAVRVDFLFEMPIPIVNLNKILKRIAEEKSVWHTKRPDATNMRKFAEDCLVGTVLSDDSIVVSGETKKCYAKEPKTIIVIQELWEDEH